NSATPAKYSMMLGPPVPTMRPILSVSGRSHRPLPDVEKRRRRRGINSRHDGWGAVDDGGAASPSERVVLRIFVGTACAGKAPAAIDRPVCRTRRVEAGAGAVLQRHRPAFD